MIQNIEEDHNLHQDSGGLFTCPDCFMWDIKHNVIYRQDMLNKGLEWEQEWPDSTAWNPKAVQNTPLHVMRLVGKINQRREVLESGQIQRWME